MSAECAYLKFQCAESIVKCVRLSVECPQFSVKGVQLTVEFTKFIDECADTFVESSHPFKC